MIRYGLAYGLRSTRRRMRSLLLPVVTTATGAFLLVEVFGLTAGVRAQADSLGDGEEVYRATLLIAVVVLLVGVVEVAVATTRTITARTRAGYRAARCSATAPPTAQPIGTTGARMPSASQSARTSLPRSSMVKGATGFSESPAPRRSSRSTRRCGGSSGTR